MSFEYPAAFTPGAEKSPANIQPEAESSNGVDIRDGESVGISAGSQHLHRKLRGKEVQLFAIGGAIGTSLFMQMAYSLPSGGPAGLFIGFVIYGTVMVAVNECFAEMVCYMPIASPFIRLGGFWVDDALSFAMGWNFFLNMALLVPFEIVAFNILITYWTAKIPVEAIVAIIIVAYGILNLISARLFGVSEFYLSIFKVLLIAGCVCYTFITMLGGNPLDDRYGFRYWKEPGAFVEHLVPGSTGRFLGLIACMSQASFTVCGPEYISIVAGETERPRQILPRAFKSFVWRLLGFYVVGALCLGIVVPSNDPTLLATIAGDAPSGTGASSPYVISMDRLHIPGLASLVNALIMTSVFSSGNGLLFSATRCLHGMSLEGKAPKFLSICSKWGVPYYSVLVVLAFCLLGFLQASSKSSSVLGWLVDLITACQLINYMSTIVVYLHFKASIDKHGIDRNTLPYKGYLQPYAAYYALAGTTIMLLLLGYSLFFPGEWSYLYFFLDYSMIAAFPLAFIFWKLIKRTKYVRPGTADLSVRGTKEEIDAYEESFVPRRIGKVESAFDKLFG